MASDRISKLPDSILSRILSWLPIKDAVSTSILSTRWRYLFVSMLNLDVDLHIFRRSPPHTIKSFTNFVDKMLFVHTQGRIELFQLNYINVSGIDASRVCGWICAALWRGVKDLDLGFARESNNIPVLPTALLFTEKTLVRLKLLIPYVMTVPAHVCLPTLKTLVLGSVVFEDDESVKRLISSCPVLEHLSISYCDMGNIKCLNISNPSLKSLTLVFDYNRIHLTFGIVIDLPCLVDFRYIGCAAESYSMGNMPSLVTADIDLSFERFPIPSEGVGFVKVFEGIGNVKSLHLTIDLEAVWFPTEKVPSCVVDQLKEFEVIHFDDDSSLFKMVTYILKNATVLENLTVNSSRVLNAEEQLKITKKLLSLPRSSTKCQVIAF
ncbi:hypothetical protein like AT2G42730 [Hibiscus trionum]|uniref:F-box domain-containing protein n=1 Tax=Hibiscus trionum TaxID=183268 RepID=A0A9W7GQ75_HIBTR|nr:hypothetical protein like AT2G42730 [Hibiscus trionum]